MKQDLATTTPTVTCVECGSPIASRESLAVAGHGLRPFHAACLPAHAARQPWYRKPSWPINRWGSLLRFNGVLIALVLGLHFTIAPLPTDAWPGLGSILLIANGWMLLARTVSWFSLERHLPSH
jgi:hypothetical protein